MGKASRNKHNRKAAETLGPDERARAAAIEGARKREGRNLPLFWIVVGLLIIGMAVALVRANLDESDEAATEAGRAAPTYADVEAPTSLPGFSDAEDDPAAGEALPTISGTGIDGKPLRISGSTGPQVVVVMAHWCPHCNREIPKIVEWAEDGNLPASVQLRGISTSAQEGQPNFPPAEWLAKERWTWPVLVDDEIGTAAEALGGNGFPFIVFVDSDGNVASRYSGEMPIDEFDEAVDQITTEPS
jgi:thiol-disulfide isomerase/thioredoxin